MEQGLDLFSRREDNKQSDLKSLPDEAKELLDTIDLMPTMVGAPPFTRDDEWIIVSIAKFIVSEYPKFGIYDVQKAFSMGAKRELRDESHNIVEINTYGQKISVNLIGKVLAAYRLHKERQRAAGSNMFPLKKKMIEAPKKEEERMTPKLAYKMLVEECRKEGQLPKYFFLYSMVYRYVKKHRGRYLFNLWGKESLKKMKRRSEDIVKGRNGALSLSNRIRIAKDSEKQFRELCVRRYFEEIAIPKMMEK